MKPYEKSTLFIAIILAIIIVLIVLGGWRERGYLAFDAGLIILMISPVIITAWYRDAKKEYLIRKTEMRRSK